MAEHVCILCRIYRPDAEPRTADVACRGDLLRLERDLLAVPNLAQRITDGDGDDPDTRFYEPDDDGRARPCDPVAALLPAGMVRAREHRPSITGSREAPLPINVDAIDLTAAPRHGTATGEARDQIGYLPAASVLDAWARHVRTAIAPDFHRPAGDVAALTQFLHRLLPTIVDELPEALPALAADLRSLCAALRRVLGDVEPVPQPLLGVRCAHCRTTSSLVPWPDNRYVECSDCGQLYNPADRDALAKAQVADLARPRHVIVHGHLALHATPGTLAVT